MATQTNVSNSSTRRILMVAMTQAEHDHLLRLLEKEQRNREKCRERYRQAHPNGRKQPLAQAEMVPPRFTVLSCV